MPREPLIVRPPTLLRMLTDAGAMPNRSEPEELLVTLTADAPVGSLITTTDGRTFVVQEVRHNFGPTLASKVAKVLALRDLADPKPKPPRTRYDLIRSEGDWWA